MIVERSNEGGGLEKRESTSRDHLLFTAKEDGSLVLFELLDVPASKASIAAGGTAVGYGPGLMITHEEYENKHRSHRPETGVQLVQEDGSSANSLPAKSRQRPSRQEKAEDEVRQDTARRAKAAKRYAVKEAAAETAASQDRNDLLTCGKCQRSFMTEGWFARHRKRWCPDRRKAIEAKRRLRRVPLLLSELDSKELTSLKQRSTQLQISAVTLKPATGRLSEPIGITLEVDDSDFVVSAVKDGSVAARTCRVHVGFKVLTVDGMPPSGTNALSDDVKSDNPVTVTFARPPPDIPRHGSARKTIHKPVQHVMLPEQEAWLRANVFADGKRLYGTRDKSAYTAMRAAFHDQIREDTMMPMWLDQKHIATWLAKQVKSEKQKRTAARKADDAGMTNAKKQRTTQTGTGKGKGKGKTKANTSTVGKKGKASKKRAASEDEEEEEDSMEDEEEQDDMEEDDGSDVQGDY